MENFNARCEISYVSSRLKSAWNYCLHYQLQYIMTFEKCLNRKQDGCEKIKNFNIKVVNSDVLLKIKQDSSKLTNIATFQLLHQQFLGTLYCNFELQHILCYQKL